MPYKDPEIRRLRQKERYWRNPERHRAKDREEYKRRRARVLARLAKYRIRNRERLNRYDQDYRKRNRERIKLRERAYRKHNPTVISAIYRRKHIKRQAAYVAIRDLIGKNSASDAYKRACLRAVRELGVQI